MSEYARRPGTTVNRYRNRGVYDKEFIHSLVNEAAVVHVSFPPSLDPDSDPFPAILPMIGVVGNFDLPEAALSEDLDVYLHGYVSSRIMRFSGAAAIGGEGEGLPVSIAATIVDGIVLSLTPNSHSYNYRSAILQGYATPVTSPEEKVFAMQLITNNVVPKRWKNTRVPPNKTEMTTTQILRVRIISASAKMRQGGPHDDRVDLEDEQLRARVWTGVVPVWEARGEPVAAEDNMLPEVPEYVKLFVEGNTKRCEDAKNRIKE